jgi:hypothetical protein
MSFKILELKLTLDGEMALFRPKEQACLKEASLTAFLQNGCLKD